MNKAFKIFSFSILFLVVVMSMVSANIDDFDLSISGAGSSSATPLTGISDSTHTFDVEVTSTLIDTVYVDWSAGSSITAFSSTTDFSTGTNTANGFELTMPDHAPSYVILTANVYSDSALNNPLGTETVYVYYDNTDYVEGPTISATLDSDAKVGQEMTITASITNNDASGSFAISVTDYSSWATFGSVTPTTLTIGADATEDSVIKLTPTASGTQTFTIEVEFDGETYTKDVSVNVEAENANTLPDEIIDANCSENDDGDLSIKIDDISVTGFGGDEDTEWFPLDEIEVEINVENDNSDFDIEDIEVHWGLYDKNNDDWYIDDKEKDFDLKDDEDETITINFKLDDNLDDLAEGDYVFYVWTEDAYLDDTDADVKIPLNVYAREDIKIEIEDDFVILDDIQILPETVSCGSEVQITADVWNIGDDKQDDVYVVIYNKELGINKKVEIGDIDDFEDKKLDATITLPSDVDEKTYNLILVVYDDNDDIYENDYDDDISEFSKSITLDSCSTVPTASITASLQSDAKAGEQLIVKAVIINTGSETKTFTISASDYTSWASLGSIDKTSVTLDKGQSADVLITLNVNGDASGEKKFNLELLEGNKFMSQPVSVSIEEQPASSVPGLTGLFSGITDGNWYLWGIGALNVLLVLLIIVVAVRVSRKKE